MINDMLINKRNARLDGRITNARECAPLHTRFGYCDACNSYHSYQIKAWETKLVLICTACKTRKKGV